MLHFNSPEVTTTIDRSGDTNVITKRRYWSLSVNKTIIIVESCIHINNQGRQIQKNCPKRYTWCTINEEWHIVRIWNLCVLEKSTHCINTSPHRFWWIFFASFASGWHYRRTTVPHLHALTKAPNKLHPRPWGQKIGAIPKASYSFIHKRAFIVTATIIHPSVVAGKVADKNPQIKSTNWVNHIRTCEVLRRINILNGIDTVSIPSDWQYDAY